MLPLLMPLKFPLGQKLMKQSGLRFAFGVDLQIVRRHLVVNHSLIVLMTPESGALRAPYKRTRILVQLGS